MNSSSIHSGERKSFLFSGFCGCSCQMTRKVKPVSVLFFSYLKSKRGFLYWMRNENKVPGSRVTEPRQVGEVTTLGEELE